MTVTELRLLKQFLTHNHSDDLLMPVKKTTKQPEFPHKNKTWDWEKYAKCKMESKDVCVLLHNLCVVDVDDLETANALENDFPMLKLAPCETTKRGKHYWFIRPIIADDLGYFDGANQRRQKVDFKSVCSTGTSGIVVVAPSDNKTWVRPLWNTPLIDMPFELLDAIALPKNAVTNLHLIFDNSEELLVTRCHWVPLMTYFEPFLSEEDRMSFDIIPVPCDKSIFVELLHVLNHNKLSKRHPTTELFNDMISLADKLGLSKDSYRRLLCGIPRTQLDMHNACPSWWLTYVDEHEWRMAGALDNDILINVTSDLAIGLEFERLVSSYDRESWLFPQIKNYQEERSLVDDPVGATKSQLPSIVLELLQMYTGNLVLAGGSVLGTVGRHVQPGSDYDLFIVGMDETQATVMLDDITHLYNNEILQTVCTGNALTMIFGDHIVVQIILRLYDNIAQVLVGFDLPPSKIGAYYDADNLFTIKCAPSWIACMKHMAFAADFTCWGYASVARLIKYKQKGFDVYVPGLRRAALLLQSATFSLEMPRCRKVSKLSSGLVSLFHLENMIVQTRSYKWRKNPLTTDEVKRCIKRLKFSSDYDVFAKAIGVIKYFVYTLTGYFKSEKVQTAREPYVFRKCEPSKVCMAMFNPLSVQFGKTYDMKTLSAILSSEML